MLPCSLSCVQKCLWSNCKVTFIGEMFSFITYYCSTKMSRYQKKGNFHVTIDKGLLVQDMKYTGDSRINDTGLMETVTLTLL